jgi:hypothetical protein
VLSLTVVLVATAATSVALFAQISPELAHQLDETFTKGTYNPKGIDAGWRDKGDSYSTVEPAADGKNTELVVYETASGKRTVAVSARMIRFKSRAIPGRMMAKRC